MRVCNKWFLWLLMFFCSVFDIPTSLRRAPCRPRCVLSLGVLEIKIIFHPLSLFKVFFAICHCFEKKFNDFLVNFNDLSCPATTSSPPPKKNPCAFLRPPPHLPWLRFCVVGELTKSMFSNQGSYLPSRWKPPPWQKIKFFHPARMIQVIDITLLRVRVRNITNL